MNMNLKSHLFVQLYFPLLTIHNENRKKKFMCLKLISQNTPHTAPKPYKNANYEELQKILYHNSAHQSCQIS